MQNFEREHEGAPGSAGTARARELGVSLGATSELADRLAHIAATINGRVVFTTSLGLEDQVLLHAMAVRRLPFEIVTLDTGRHFPETYQTLAESERGFDVKIKVMFPEAAEVEALVARDGIMGFRGSIEARKACCEVRKARPLHRALRGAAAWITGLRREQSENRGDTPFAEFDGKLDLIKINPLADFTLAQLTQYAARHAIPKNPLHAKGFASIGCEPCTRAIKPGEHPRAGRWWWEDEPQKECGLHNRPGYALAGVGERP